MQAETFHFNIGKFKCIAINDGYHRYAPSMFPPPATMLFCNAPVDQLEPLLAQHNIKLNEWAAWVSPYICLLINTGEQLVLVDTGANGLSPDTGNLIKNLQDEGITPEDIDIIILTHAHPDHISGNTLDNGQLAFPKAQFVMSKTEWEFWTSGEAEASLDEKTREVLLSVTQKNLSPIAGKVELIDGDKVIIPGIRAISAPGHTPGHMAILISSNEEQLLHIVDAFLHPVHLEHPEWHAIFDQSPEQVLTTRTHLIELAITINPLVMAFHFPFPGLGHIIKKDRTWEWKPITIGEN